MTNNLENQNIIFYLAFKNLKSRNLNFPLCVSFENVNHITASLDETLKKLDLSVIRIDKIKCEYIDWLEENDFLQLTTF